MKAILVNVASLLLLLALSMLYVSVVADSVPPDLALVVNVVLVPTVLGALSYFLIQGPLYIAVGILAVLPIAHVLYFGGDPAKPGLERFVAIIEFLFLCLGLVLAYFGKRYLSSK